MRNNRTWVVMIAVLAVVVLGGWWLSARQAPQGAKIVAAPPASESGILPPVSPAPQPPPPPPATKSPARESAPPMRELFIAPDTVLAQVNDTNLTLKDLRAVNPASTGQIFRADAYAHFLTKAIEREVTFQGAKARGVELTDTQKQDLEGIRAAALARGKAPYAAPGYDAEAQAAFEVRDRTAQMLQNVMLNESGTPSQYVTPQQVQDYYAQHQAEFDALPKNPEARAKAWQLLETEIRARLIPDVYREHEHKRQNLLTELKAGLTIEQFVAADRN